MKFFSNANFVLILCIGYVTEINSYLYRQYPKSHYWRRVLQMSSKPGLDDELKSNSVVGTITLLKCEKLTKSYTGVPQFNDISFMLGKGQRVGLIGVNGAGKSTFLKCLARVDGADSGIVESIANTNIVFVEQDPSWVNTSVYEAIFSENTHTARAAKKYMFALDPNQADSENALVDAIDDMETANAWEYHEKGMNLATKLNIDGLDMYRPMSSLSGGQKKRVALTAALLLQPDVLLLDEPTNHLDIDALDWLADYLRPGGLRENKDMAVLLVTHDRFFLERVCSEIVELDRGSMYRYPCNYGKYLEMKVARLAAEDAETERARTKLRRESEWMARQPKARQAKSQSRQNAFFELVDKAKGRSADAKAVELATPEEKAKQTRLGGVVAQFKGAGYSLTDAGGRRVKLLDDFTYEFRQRDRIGIVGPNGVGKSTFLKILSGELQLESGTMRLGDTVKIGYYEQQGLILTPEQEKQPVLKFVQEECERASSSDKSFSSGENAPQIAVTIAPASSMGRRDRLAGKEASVSVEIVSTTQTSVAFSEREAMSLLTRFQFPSKRWYDRVGQLSGGERRRLQLLQILAAKPNVLLLDEPSNDLDLSTLSALEEYLTEVFEGCLVVVSHDNFFVNRVAEHLFVFQGGGIVRDFQGSYTEYLEYRKDSLQEEKDELKQQQQQSSGGTKSKNSKGSSSPTNAAGGEPKSFKSNAVNTPPATSTSKASSSTASNNLKSKEDEGKLSAQSTSSGKKRELSYSERKDMNKLEKDIAKLNNQVSDLERKMAQESENNSGFSVLSDLSKNIELLKGQIEMKESAWLELAEIAGEI